MRIFKLTDVAVSEKLATSKDIVEIYRSQGSLTTLRKTKNLIENIKGNYDT